MKTWQFKVEGRKLNLQLDIKNENWQHPNIKLSNISATRHLFKMLKFSNIFVQFPKSSQEQNVKCHNNTGSARPWTGIHLACNCSLFPAHHAFLRKGWSQSGESTGSCDGFSPLIVGGTERVGQTQVWGVVKKQKVTSSI